VPFEKSPPELVARFQELADLVPGADRKQMFGYPSCVLDGHMFMGLFEDHLVLRLRPADLEAFLAEEGGEPFEPMPGRPMTGYVVVPATMVAQPEVVDRWVAKALACARELPPKKPKAAKKPKAPRKPA
jgi:TfoX/Sxy family transcriptional regulator of competence genes